MLSVVILGAGLSFVANAYILSARGLNTASNKINALNLAREKMQELELTSLGKGLASSSFKDKITLQSRDYEYSQEVSEFIEPQEASKNLLEACLEISWKEQNLAKNVILSTYLLKETDEKEQKEQKQQ